MKGALLELAARGTEDILLIGNPEFSYFKSVHRRHTNFSRFESRQIFQGEPKFGKKISITLDKKGDLLKSMMLEIKLPATGDPATSWINGIGNFMIKEVVLKIGGEQIVKMPGEYIDLFYRYYLNFGHYVNYTSAIKRISGYFPNSLIDAQTVYVMLPFWFTKELSQALPVISLGYHDITLDVEFRPLIDCLFNGSDKSTLAGFNLEIESTVLWCDFIYLDKWERQMFLNKEELNYLIEQVQDNEFMVESGGVNKNYKLIFNLPVKELVWLYRSAYWESFNRWDIYATHNYSTGKDLQALEEVGLQFNGLDRTDVRNADYYRFIQPILYHNSSTNDYIYIYSFADDADSIQPSGTANFSQIDDARLIVKFYPYISTGRVKVWAINYNFMRIQKGMAGILYSS